jgi:hypothetical protein
LPGRCGAELLSALIPPAESHKITKMRDPHHIAISSEPCKLKMSTVKKVSFQQTANDYRSRLGDQPARATWKATRPEKISDTQKDIR